MTGEAHSTPAGSGLAAVAVPVREIVEKDKLPRTAVFEISGKAVLAFEVLT